MNIYINWSNKNNKVKRKFKNNDKISKKIFDKIDEYKFIDILEIDIIFKYNLKY